MEEPLVPAATTTPAVVSEATRAVAAVAPAHLENLHNALAVFRQVDQAEIHRLKGELLRLQEKVATERSSSHRILGRLCDLHTNVADLRDELLNLACEMDTSL